MPGWIDAHQHIVPESYKAALARLGVRGSGENPWPAWSAAEAIDMMGEGGIAAAITSVASPGIHFGEIAATRDLARLCNEASARLVADHPGTFAGLAVLPLPDVAAAAAEAAYALDVLRLDGVILLTHTADRYLGQAEEWELYAELDRRGALVFVHPIRPPATGLPRTSYPAGYTELVFDTTRAIANLLATGTLARFPNLRWLMSHAGGTVPFLIYRLSQLDDAPGVRERLPEGVAAHLKRLNYDMAQCADAGALQALRALVPDSQILFGTDYPFALDSRKSIRDALVSLDVFSPDAQRLVGRDNAVRLCPSLGQNT